MLFRICGAHCVTQLLSKIKGQSFSSVKHKCFFYYLKLFTFKTYNYFFDSGSKVSQYWSVLTAVIRSTSLLLLVSLCSVGNFKHSCATALTRSLKSTNIQDLPHFSIHTFRFLRFQWILLITFWESLWFTKETLKLRVKCSWKSVWIIWVNTIWVRTGILKYKEWKLQAELPVHLVLWKLNI